MMAPCDPASLIFLDETSTPTNMTPLRARSRKGERAIGQVPRGRWHTTTLLASLTLDGLGPGLQFPGPIDRIAFDTFVEQILVPTLTPGQTVVLDNLAVHKSPHARQLIEDAGGRLVFLPTYSPDFNPIEQAFAKLKHLLRKAAARTTSAVMIATENSWATITAADALGFFKEAGYNL